VNYEDSLHNGPHDERQAVARKLRLS